MNDIHTGRGREVAENQTKGREVCDKGVGGRGSDGTRIKSENIARPLREEERRKRGFAVCGGRSVAISAARRAGYCCWSSAINGGGGVSTRAVSILIPKESQF